MSNHLGPAERSERTNAVADALVATLRRPKNDGWAISKLSESLVALCAQLDRRGAVRAADALLVVLDGPNVSAFRFVLPERLFKRVAARLDEPDLQRLLDHPLAAGPLQRFLPDVLAGSRNRSCRNTWGYLDWTESNRTRGGLFVVGAARC